MLPSPEYLITSALPVGEYCLRHIDLNAAGELLDFLNLMGYDFTGGWTDVSGHQAQLLPPSSEPDTIYPTLRKSCSGGVEYALSRGFPAHKILLGVPVYARYFSQARGPGQPFSGGGEMDYCDLPEEWVNEAHIEHKVGAASYVDHSGEKGFVSFDVPATVAIKSQYVKETGLGGLFYWTGAGDRTDGWSLVATGFRELNS
jgi:chitinase